MGASAITPDEQHVEHHGERVAEGIRAMGLRAAQDRAEQHDGGRPGWGPRRRARRSTAARRRGERLEPEAGDDQGSMNVICFQVQRMTRCGEAQK